MRFSLPRPDFRALILLWTLALTPAAAQEIKLTPDDPSAVRDLFGVSVAIAGNSVLVGAPQDNELGFHAGAAYLYHVEKGAWVLKEKLLAPQGTIDDNFGAKVTLSDRWAMITSPLRKDSLGNAVIHIYRHRAGVLTPASTVNPPALSPELRLVSVSDLDGNRAAFLANNAEGTDEAVVLYEFKNEAWKQVATLRASNGKPDDLFGGSVALDGDRILIGARQYDRAGFLGSGTAYIFEKQGGSWVQTAQIEPDTTSSVFGFDVALSGPHAIVSDYTSGLFQQASGAAYAFRLENGSWNQVATLGPADPAARDFFGISVAAEGNRALVGAYGDGTDREAGPNTGAVYAFTFDGTTWSPAGTLNPSDGGPFDAFGRDVALSGDRAIVGACKCIGKISDYYIQRGAAYVYRLQESLDAPNVIPAGDGVDIANYPNPFNPTTTIRFTLAATSEAQLLIYDTLGREVALLLDGVAQAGSHEVSFDAGNLPGGTYLYRLVTPVGSQTRVMVLLK